ncbi:DUF3772 domain-containing protein [Ketogulonicigenium vulgare]|uniref:Transporter, MscS family protein n=2 Tax=Ketogulonicigenium vulgare TaxID=92945 RepID=F9Y6T1_KETVW|nr:DUF3772 domain-containing protein [Ketogulonicigenium vulgare]AEM40948.1 Transporter, MscS family protein [Ketogulonicigenium vulgare WSH-001]ALJ81101.1 mechanosensitive ion channel protein MscS [Ketogulonicigenium vulgare]ANW33851.1 mechanosensitive ion channel protein MscS [Ketogulonicigenium vulgare]AOZ54673.1 Transporter, MscS family protein [Ketogulonicigenium vulgare]
MMLRHLIAGFALLLASGAALAQEAPVAVPEETATDVATEVAPDLDPRIVYGIMSGIDYSAWADRAARVEALVALPSPSSFALDRARTDLVAWRDIFSPQRSQNVARIATVQAQITALGDTATAAPAIVARATELTAQLSALQAPARLADEAFAQADGLIAEIDRLLRERQNAALMVRALSPLSPSVLSQTYAEFTSRISGLGAEVYASVQNQNRLATFADRAGLVILMLLGSLVMIFGIGPFTRRLRVALGQRFPDADSVTGYLMALCRAVVQLLGVLLLTNALKESGLFGYRASILINALPGAGGVIIMMNWVGGRFFTQARANPPPFDFSPEVRQKGKHLTWELGWMMAGGLMLLELVSTSETPEAVRNAFSLPVVLMVAFTLFRFGRLIARAAQSETATAADTTAANPIWSFALRIVGQGAMALAVLAPAIMLIGFGQGAEWLLYPAVMTLVLLAALVALQWFVFDVFALIMHSRDVAQSSLWPVLVAIALMVLSLPVLALIWGARVDDLGELAAQLAEGFDIGGLQLSPMAVLTFIIVFGIGLMLTRLVQAVMAGTVLPRTRLDRGGQTALVSGIRYLGLTAAALAAFSMAGLNLSSLAVVAGALSVGIGFGMQNIVQNFVSGIILLAGRAIRQGDWIEVGGVSGYVREISVRSTRIETFDRSDVIVPNASLVAGQVVNWTRGNAVGRITVAATTAYGTDPVQVMEILRAAAESHPMVLLSPKPTVLMTGFAADTMNFEVKALVRDINAGGSVRSDITVEVARRFNAAGIQSRNGLAPLPVA